MDSAANSVILERFHLDALVDDALAGHGGITVHYDRYDLFTVFSFSSEEVLLGAGSALHARINSFQMRGIGQKCQLDFCTRRTVTATESGSEMILDITSLSSRVVFDLRCDSLELSHDDFHGLADHIG